MTVVKQEEDDTTSDISGSQITHGNAQKHTYDDYWIRFQIIDIILTYHDLLIYSS